MVIILSKQCRFMMECSQKAGFSFNNFEVYVELFVCPFPAALFRIARIQKCNLFLSAHKKSVQFQEILKESQTF